MKYDWHGYGLKIIRKEAAIKESQISEKNKKSIFDFERYLITSALSKPRILKYLEIIKTSTQMINKDFDLITKDDMMDYISIIEQKNYSEHTKHTYKVIIRKFFQWFKKCEDKEYPAEVKWIKTNIRKDRLTLPSEGDLLTEPDIQKLMNSAKTLRDKAFISCLWESGCRVGEISTIKIKEIVFDEYGCIFNVTGKTGPRQIRLINSAPYLANWLGTHPNRDDREQFVWASSRGKTKGRLLNYATICKTIQEMFAATGIKKKCNPHIFRHSRATFLANHLTEFQMNRYFGWVQGSNMPGTYIHLSGKETEKALLKLNGVITQEDNNRILLSPQKCPRCSIINTHESKFCNKCGLVLDLKEAMTIEENKQKVQTARDQMDIVMNMLMKDPEVVEAIRKKMEKMTNPEIAS